MGLGLVSGLVMGANLIQIYFTLTSYWKESNVNNKADNTTGVERNIDGHAHLTGHESPRLKEWIRKQRMGAHQAKQEESAAAAAEEDASQQGKVSEGGGVYGVKHGMFFAEDILKTWEEDVEEMEDEYDEEAP